MNRVEAERGRSTARVTVLVLATVLAVPFVAFASPAYNVFANAEFEACVPPSVQEGVLDEPFPASVQGRSNCPPWLLRNAEGASGHETQSRMGVLLGQGHGNTNSARVTYDAADGIVLMGQHTGVTGDVRATAWRAIHQVTFDYRTFGTVHASFRADGITEDGQRVTVNADEGVVALASNGQWVRESFTLSGLVEPDGRRVPFTGLWFEIHPGTATGATFDVDNVYATNLYLEPYPLPYS